MYIGDVAVARVYVYIYIYIYICVCVCVCVTLGVCMPWRTHEVVARVVLDASCMANCFPRCLVCADISGDNGGRVKTIVVVSDHRSIRI
jgi:hypothetical protein